MGRYTGPKHKIARREGVNILEKSSQSLERRLNVPPGTRLQRRRRKLSEFGVQLREKQKLKRIYGLYERQFRNYVKSAQKKRGNTEEALIQLLETRLDNILYRLSFAKSRPHARQIVSHRHVLVNGKKVNIPSYSVKKEDVITVDDKFKNQEELKTRLDENPEVLPFIKRQNFQGKIVKLPSKEDVTNPVNYQLVIEFYSR